MSRLDLHEQGGLKVALLASYRSADTADDQASCEFRRERDRATVAVLSEVLPRTGKRIPGGSRRVLSRAFPNPA